jgi:hypothetical protein
VPVSSNYFEIAVADKIYMKSFEIGSISHDYYTAVKITYRVIPPNYKLFITRFSHIKVWDKLFDDYLGALHSMKIDRKEKTLYIIGGENPLLLIKINAKDGGIQGAEQNQDLKWTSDTCQIFFDSKETRLYFAPYFLTYSDSFIWSYLIEGGYITWYSIGEGSTVQALNVLSDGQLFYSILKKTGPTQDLMLQKYKFGTLSSEWTKSMQWSGLSWALFSSSSVFDKSSGVIYAGIGFQDVTKNNYFFQFYSNGTTKGNRYIMSRDWDKVPGMTFYQGNIYMEGFWTVAPAGTYIFQYDVEKDSFQRFKSISGWNLFAIRINNFNKALVLSGTWGGSNVARFEMDPHHLILHSDLDSTTVTWNIVTDPVKNLITDLGTYSGPFNQPLLPYSLTVVSISITSIPSMSQEFNLDFIDEDFLNLEIPENAKINLDIDLSWSHNSLATVTNSLAPYNLNIPPSWVALDENEGKLLGHSPRVQNDEDYIFSIEYSTSLNASDVSQRLVHLRVIKWFAENCNQWEIGSNQRWEIWVNKFEVYSSYGVWQKSKMSAETKGARFITLGWVLVAIGISGVASLVNFSSSATIWIITNQLRLLTLLLLTGGYFPKSIVYLLTSNNIFSSSFPIINDYLLLDKTHSYFGYEQDNFYLKSIGIESKSSFVNNIGRFVSVILILISHALSVKILRLLNKKYSQNKCLDVISKKVYNFFLLAVYIRFTYESFQFSILSSLSELYRMNVETSTKAISIIVASLLLISSLIFLTWIFIISYLSSRSEGRQIPPKYKETIEGIKNKKLSQFYMPFSLARIVVFVSFLLLAQSTNSKLRVLVLGCLQAAYLISVIIIRPFKLVKDNAILAINESILWIISFSIIRLQSYEAWNSRVIRIFTWIIVGNSVVTMLIVLIDLLIRIIKGKLNRKEKVIQPKVNETVITPKTNQRLEDMKVENFDIVTEIKLRPQPMGKRKIYLRDEY